MFRLENAESEAARKAEKIQIVIAGDPIQHLSRLAMILEPAVDDRSPRVAVLTVTLAIFLFSFFAPIGIANASVNSSSAGNVTSSISYVPPPTGCTLPGYTAPVPLLTTLGASSTTKALSFKTAPQYVMTSLNLFLFGLLVIGILILVGIGLLIAGAISGRRHRNEPGQVPVRRSHRRRNAFLAIFFIVILITAANFAIIFPYLNLNKNNAQAKGVVQNILAPTRPISLDPISILYFYVPAYVNNQTTLLEGNYTVTSGTMQVFVIPGAQLNQLGDEVRNGTLNGVSGCSIAGFTVYYDSGLGTSGAFAVQLPAVTNQTTFDVVFANPSSVNQTTAIGNVYWGY
jgi:hypothetical protein